MARFHPPGTSRRGSIRGCLLRYELSRRVNTGVSEETLLIALLGQFKKISGTARRDNHQVLARRIENTIGATFRTTQATITPRAVDGGYLLVADVTYKPSLGFALAFLSGLPFILLWLIPVAFYLTQKGAVRSAVERALSRVRDEFDGNLAYTAPAPPPPPTMAALASELSALDKLRIDGVLTMEEFTAQKRRLLAASCS